MLQNKRRRCPFCQFVLCVVVKCKQWNQALKMGAMRNPVSLMSVLDPEQRVNEVKVRKGVTSLWLDLSASCLWAACTEGMPLLAQTINYHECLPC